MARGLIPRAFRLFEYLPHRGCFGPVVADDDREVVVLGGGPGLDGGDDVVGYLGGG